MVPDRLRPLLDQTAPLADRFVAAGKRLYLVGGSVRDAILGRPLDTIDLDFTTDARPDDIEAIVSGWADAVWDQGRALRHDRLQEGRSHLRDHHPPGRGLRARVPQA